MPLSEILMVALVSLRANTLRSMLTMLGIVIGVGAVIAMIALGNGAENAVKARIARLGTTTLWVNPQRVQQAGIATTQTAKLTMLDVQAIEERARNVVGVTPQQDRSYPVLWRNKNASIQITGTTPNFLSVRGFSVAAGEMFTLADGEHRRKVAVLGGGAPALLEILSPEAIIGERIRIAGQYFTVVGVLTAKGSTGFGDNDDQILIPFQTGQFRVFGTDRLNDVWVKVGHEDSVTVAMGEIQLALRHSHRIAPGRPDDFTVRNQTDALNTLSETTQTFTILLAAIAAVSLLVGGIGIMNIMLVSVTERTREIGVRKALGATRRDILAQFLFEAVAMCLVGGAVGVAAGVAGATVLQQSLGWNTAVDIPSVLLAFGFAASVGVLFGVWPARRAAVLDPIEALRYE